MLIQDHIQSSFLQLFPLIIFLPFFNFIFLSVFGHKVEQENSIFYVCTNMFLTFHFSALLFYIIITEDISLVGHIFNWIESGSLFINWSLNYDPLSATMLIVVTSISTCVHIYSIEYMSEDPHLKRFISYLSLFTFFMLILVTSNNLLQLFVGWEGVGLCSYLLINFWFNRLQANKAALKAMIVNRIGDFGLAMGLFTIFYGYRSLDFSILATCTPTFINQTFSLMGTEFDLLTIAAIFLFIGAVGKSAQIGLHTWLPDAMEGPTPVSALIHAATMVTAGVFLICRCATLFQYTPTVALIITLMGSFTAFMAGTIGLVQNDLKRVIAYSTCSQLGYMVFACGASNYFVSMFHLANHAFFKAALFMGAGSVIHAFSDEQDMRRMGGSLPILFFTYIVMLIGSMSLMGFPFLTGFFSKDAILELNWSYWTISTSLAGLLGLLAAGTTAFYSLRGIAKTFLVTPNGFKKIFFNAHESGYWMSRPLYILSFGGILVGFFGKDMFIGAGSTFWQQAIMIKPQENLFFEAEFLENWIKELPLIFTIIGSFLAFFIYNYNTKTFKDNIFLLKLTDTSRLLYTFLNRKWFFDKFYNEWINQHVLNFSYKETYQNTDRGFIEMLGSNGLYKRINYFSSIIAPIQFDLIYHILSWILWGSFGIFLILNYLDWFLDNLEFGNILTLFVGLIMLFPVKI